MATYARCKSCKKQMFGIKDHGARDVCEPCGGNATEYDAENPHPQSPAAEKRNG